MQQPGVCACRRCDDGHVGDRYGSALGVHHEHGSRRVTRRETRRDCSRSSWYNGCREAGARLAANGSRGRHHGASGQRMESAGHLLDRSGDRRAERGCARDAYQRHDRRARCIGVGVVLKVELRRGGVVRVVPMPAMLEMTAVAGDRGSAVIPLTTAAIGTASRVSAGAGWRLGSRCARPLLLDYECRAGRRVAARCMAIMHVWHRRLEHTAREGECDDDSEEPTDQGGGSDRS